MTFTCLKSIYLYFTHNDVCFIIDVSSINYYFSKEVVLLYKQSKVQRLKKKNGNVLIPSKKLELKLS